MRATGQTPVISSSPRYPKGLPVSGGLFFPVGTTAFPAHPGTDAPTKNAPAVRAQGSLRQLCRALSPQAQSQRPAR